MAATSNIDDLMNQAVQGAVTSTQNYSKALDKYGGMGANTSGLKKTMAEEDKVISQLPTSVPKAPALEKALPDAPKAPEVNPLDTFKQFAPALAIFGSLATRHPLKSAMFSAAAAMNAHAQGKQQEFENAQKQWADQVEKITRQNQMELDEYNAAVSESKGNIAALQGKLTALGAKFQDQHVIEGLQAGNIDRVLEKYEKQSEIQTKLVDALGKYKKNVEDSRALSESDYDQFKADPGFEGVKKAYHSGAPMNLLVKGWGKDASKYTKAVQRAVQEEDPDFNWANAHNQYLAEASSKRSVATQAGKIELAANMLDQSLPSMMEAAEKVGLTPSTNLNEIFNAVKKRLSSQDFSNFSTQLRAVTSDYAQFLGRGRQTVHSDQEALRILSEDMGINSLQGFVDAVNTERTNTLNAIDITQGKKPADNVVHWDDLK